MKASRLFRDAAVSLAEYAAGGTNGRGKLDPVYVEVTEGRDKRSSWKHYSSCGDLAHWLLYRLGCRSPWINRDEHTGWKSGVNVSNLTERGKLPSGRDWHPEPGDIILIWNHPEGFDAHVTVCLGNGWANYGAGGMTDTEFPGANISRHELKWTGQVWKIGSRQVQRHISLDSVSFSAEIDPRGLMTGEELDALGKGETSALSDKRD